MGFLNAVSELAGKCRVWSHAKVERKCLEAGHQFVQMAKANDGRLTIDQLNSVYRGILPKGVKLQAVSDPKEAEVFLRDMKFDERTIACMFRAMQAFVQRNLNGEALLFIPIEKFSGAKAVNASTHEFEHVLSQETTLFGKFGRLIFKVLGQKRVEKLALKDAKALGMKFVQLPQELIGAKLNINDPFVGVSHQSPDRKGLLERLGLASEKELREGLTGTVRKVLEPKSETQNIRALKVMKYAIADEARAYRVGGQAAREYLELKKGSTNAEMVSQIYDETVGVIKQEIKAQKRKRRKRFFGLTVEDYEGARSTTTSTQTIEEALKDGTIKKTDIVK